MSRPSIRIVPAVDVPQAGDEPGERRLARPGRPDEGEGLPCRDGQRDVAQDRAGRARSANDTPSSSIAPATRGIGRASGASTMVGRVSMISNTRSMAPVPSRNWPYSPAIVPRLAAIATPYSRNPVSVPIPSWPSMTWWPVYQSSAARAPKPRNPISAPNAARHRASREPVATTRRAGRRRSARAPSPRGRSS